MSEYVEKIISIASEVFGVEAADLNEESTWIDDLKLDVVSSLQNRNFVDFIGKLEEEFEIEIQNMKFGKTKNIKEMAAYVEKLCEE